MSLPVNHQIGNKIQLAHQNGTEYTPIEKNRNLAAFISVVGAAALEYTAATTAVSTATTACALAGMPMLAGGLVALTYYGLIATDYDNPKQRSAMIDEVSKSNLIEIAEKHTIENVLGYDLLGMSPSGYETYKDLAKNHYQSKKTHSQSLRLIQLEYHKNLAPFSNQLYHARQQDDLHRIGRNGHAERWENNNQTQQNISWGIDLVERGIDLYNIVDAQKQYDLAVQTFTEIKNDKIAEENAAYNSHCRLLNQSYQNI
ncbi:MAG: hypothetical protein KAR79_04645 [Simkaniaceae bacterium]|nr:hypothetical protein [Simkaniaceae bacterium]